MTPAALAHKKVKEKYGKPRQRLRKHSLQPLPKLKKKADRMLQDFYREFYRYIPCESCGRPFEIMHHFIEKSLSAGLRFEGTNLVFLCQSCHTRHHRGGDPAVVAAILSKRGMEWFDKLNALRIERKVGWVVDRPFLESQLVRYDIAREKEKREQMSFYLNGPLPDESESPGW
jgi:hypothetical protein